MILLATRKIYAVYGGGVKSTSPRHFFLYKSDEGSYFYYGTDTPNCNAVPMKIRYDQIKKGRGVYQFFSDALADMNRCADAHIETGRFCN